MKQLLKPIIALSCLLIFAAPSLRANNPDTTNYYRKQLQELLEARKEKFESYSESLEQRSGIFGNKTKNDIRESNHVLIEIVRTDNKIISTLNRVIDFRNYEKINMNYDLNKHQNQQGKLLAANDTLNKQLILLKKENKQIESSNFKLKFALVLALLGLCIVFMWRRKRAIQ